MAETEWRSPGRPADVPRWRARAAVAALCATLAVNACTCERAVQVARGDWLSYIYDKRNSCLLKRAGELGFLEAAVGAHLFGGDTLKTGRDASAQLKFRDGSTFDLKPESLIVLSEAAPAASGGERRIEIALLEGDLTGTVVDPAKARVDVTWGRGGDRIQPRAGSTSSLIFTVSARGDRGAQVTAGEATVSGDGRPDRVLTPPARMLTPAAGPEPSGAAQAARESEARRDRAPARVRQELLETAVPVITQPEMDQLVARASALEKLTQRSMSKIKDAEAAAARDLNPRMVSLRSKLGDLRVAMVEVGRLTEAVLSQANKLKDQSRRAAILAEIVSIEELQRDLARDLATIEGEMKAAPAR